MRLGAALVPLNARLAEPELLFQLRDCAPRLLVGGGRHLEMAKDLRAACGVPLWEVDPGALAAGPEATGGPWDLEDPAAIVYTSGTTGSPKGAVLTRGNFLRSAEASALQLGLCRSDRWLLCMPLFHVGGLSILWRAALYGIAVVAHESFSEHAALQAMREDGVTIASFVPTMLERIMAATRDPLPAGLRAILLGGAPAAPQLLLDAVGRGIPIYPTYGLTEAASQVATLAPELVAQRPGSAGKPLFWTEVAIALDDGRAAAAGEVGEICVRGPTVTAGYFGNPEATAQILREGWLHTGDLGYLDADGYLYALDRRDDLIVSGGENVYPAEVESALRRHPRIVDAGVYAVPDEVWGQVPMAAVVAAPGDAPSVRELLDFLAGEIARYKLPKAIRFVQELPRNAGGKLERRRLRAAEGGGEQ